MASVENSSCPPQKRALKPPLPLPTSTHTESSKSKADLSVMMVLQKPGVKRELLAADIRHRCRSRSSVFCTSEVSGVARMSSKRYWNAKLDIRYCDA
ncbi:hypothetical protein E4U30_006192 [Claviceps sp. LM220 group G6]|nr:hypothetical protein E4U15_000511 [Claviceps sp. LM218 group G6]KAG6091896.1 hypothetical protein E4U30_006192 [Claviceps sp. LM220 group G6]